jgi:hypothetical protein
MEKQFLPKTDFPFKSYDKKLIFSKVMEEWAAFFPVGYKEKRPFFPNLCGQLLQNFCTCSFSSLGQDLMVKNANKIYVFLFGLLELEMVVLRCFLRKMNFVL